MSYYKNSFNKFYKRKRQPSENSYDHVEDYFNKRYKFCDEHNWSFPKPTDLYIEETWNLEQFQEMKTELNSVKGQLSEFNLEQWSQHTKMRDPSGYVFRELKKHIKPELLTQAWCKFYECINQFCVIPEEAINNKQLNTLHLCEAPGAFISALNHYIFLNHPDLKWNWLANSLNPEYEGNDLRHMIPDKRLLKHTRSHWNFGADNTGDLLKYYNYETIVSAAQEIGEILLVTADGSVDCMSNPGEQESLVEHLHFCEVITGLTVLAPGGTFVIKMFTMFECSSICLLYLLNNCFLSVNVFKPCTSKSGNSEVYVICLNYKGKSKFNEMRENFENNYKYPNTSLSMFPLKTIPKNFITQVEKCAKFFMQKQIKTITDNIFLFENISQHEYRKNDYIKNSIAQCFLIKYKLKPMDKHNCLMKWTPYKNKLNFNVNLNDFYTEVLNSDIQLKIEIGKQINQVLYSEFCDQKYIKSFHILNDPVSVDIFRDQCKKFNINEKNSLILNVCFNNNNDKYILSIFNLFNNTLFKLKPGNNVVIFGSLYLTRFEACLIYLFILCFSKVQYYAGILVLSNARNELKNICKIYNQIDSTIKDVSKIDCEEYHSFILNILPEYFITNEIFFTFLKNYNNETMNYIFSFKEIII